MKLSVKLPAMFATALLFVLSVALYGVFSLNQSLGTFENVVGANSDHERAILNMAVSFKTQIQEWKNTLIRGSNPKDLDKHWRGFTKEESDVADIAKKMLRALPEGESKTLVEKFAQAHAEMGVKYRKALETFTAAGFDSRQGDAAVQGMDREPSRLLAEAVKKIGADSAAVSVSAAAQGKRALTISLALTLLVSAASVVAVVVMSRGIVNQLGGELHVAVGLAQSVTRGDLDGKIELRPGDSTSLMAHLVAMQSNLARVVSEVRSGSEAVATASAEIAQGNQDLSSRTESQASALEQTAASMEQLGATVKQNADSARQANQLSMSASTVAVRGGEVVGQVVETMKGINDSSRKIGDIISVIDGIAFQTNILALNAAVEAARAGEQGRGFAVVASEVRSLAGRSAEAAKEIKSLINASVERVEQGSALVDQAGITMTEVVSSIRRVTDIMGEISAASNEQSLGVSQVGEAVTQMDQATQQNAALVEEMAAAASSLKSQAQELVQVVAVFKLGAGQEHHPVSKLAAVRSREPKAQPHGGAQRRLAGVAKGAAARGHGSAVKAAPAAALPLADMRSKTVSKATPAGGDADWESF